MDENSNGSSLSEQELLELEEQNKTTSAPVTEMVKAFTEAITNSQVDKNLLKHQAHGISVGDMKKLKEAQANGTVEMMQANRVSRFMIPVIEKDFIHFSTERVKFDENTSEKRSKPKYNIKTVADFEKMSQVVRREGQTTNPENAFAGLKVVILHDPRTGVSENSKREQSHLEKLMSASLNEVEQIYKEVFNEEPLPSDSIDILRELIREKVGI